MAALIAPQISPRHPASPPAGPDPAGCAAVTELRWRHLRTEFLQRGGDRKRSGSLARPAAAGATP